MDSFTQPLPDAPPRDHNFSESGAWESVGEGWRPLSGSFRDLGYSVEWHDFSTEGTLDWSPSFHPRGIEICLNLAGRGEVRAGNRQLEFGPSTAGFYFQNKAQLKGQRKGGERHQFLTVELSLDFLARLIEPKESDLHPALKNLFSGKSSSDVSEAIRLSNDHQQLALTLSRPPVSGAARRLWYHAKTLEIASGLLFKNDASEELFCERHKRQNSERVGRVIALLKENLAEPPALEEIGRRVGCSHFYLSRIFSQEMGRGIFQHLRALRLERAAELLRERKMNVTQVALEVGYSSPSHFSTAFHETFGCCPGLYPLRTLSPEVTARLKNSRRS